MRADSFDNILKKIDSSMTSSDKGNYIYRFMFITIQDLDTPPKVARVTQREKKSNKV